MTWRQKENSFVLNLNGIPFDIDEPEGYVDLESIIERDREAHGTFFEYTPAEFPLRFTGLAKSLLRVQFDNYGVDAQAALQFQVGQTFNEAYEIGYKHSNGTASSLDTYDAKLAQTFTITEAGTIFSAYMFLKEMGILLKPEHNIRIVICDTVSGAPNSILSQIDNVYDTRTGELNTLEWVGSDQFDLHVSPGVYAVYVQAIDDGGAGMGAFQAAYFNRHGSGYADGGSYRTTADPWDYTDWSSLGNDFDFKIGFTPDPTPIFAGQVDFSQARDNQNYFSCTILRSDLLIKLRNNIDKKINLLSGTDIYGNYAYPISEYTTHLHSFVIKKQFTASQPEDDDFDLTIDDIDHAMVTYSFPTKEINEMDEVVNRRYELRTYQVNSEYATWLVVDEPGDYTITFNYDFNYEHRIANISGPNTDYTHTINVKIALFRPGYYVEGSETNVPLLNDDSNFVETDSILSSISTFGPGGDTTLTGRATGSLSSSKSLDVLGQLEKGDWILVWTEFDCGNFQAGIETTYKYWDHGSSVAITANTRYPEGTAKSLLVGDAIEQCVRAITGNPIPLDSDFFAQSGCGHNNVLTNGYQLRGIDKPILASFRDLFHKGVQPIFGLGYSVEESKIKMELWEYFYQETELLDLGIVGDYEEEVLGDDIFNQCTFGFRTYANDENLASTLDDIHTQGSWNTPIENVKGEFVQVSDFLLSSFLIEQTRRLALTEKPTISNRYDDKLFMVATEKDYEGPDYDFRAELSDIYSTATGMENIETAYNLRHTIKRMLMNWGVWINSFAFRYESDDSKLINLYFLNNGSLVTQFDSGEECGLGDTELAEITENADVNYLDLQEGEAKFDQVKMTFTKQLTQEQLDLIRDAHDGDLQVYQGRYGYIKVTDYNGIEQTGWLLRLQTNIYTNLGKFELLKRHIRTIRTIIFNSFCLTRTGHESLNATQKRIVQYISVSAGTLKSITFDALNYGHVIIGIRRMGNNDEAWQGDPLFTTTEVLYDWKRITVFPGENILTLNATVETADVYSVHFLYDRATSNGISYFILDNPPQSCLKQPILQKQIEYTASGFGAWSHTFPVQLKYEYDYATTDMRSVFICSTNYHQTCPYHNDDKFGQLIELFNDCTFKEVNIWTHHDGSPTGTWDCVISTADGSGFPDVEKASTSFTPVDGGVNTIAFDQELVAAKYVIWFRYNADGSMDSSNKPCFRVVTDSFAYRYGAYREYQGVLGGPWTEDPSWLLMIKYKFTV